MKILLTGSTGFLGNALKKKLNKRDLILTSRSIDKNAPFFFKKNISSKEDFSDCLKDIEVVIHTAARVHQMKDIAENPLYMVTNCLGTLNLANQSVLAGVKRFIFISSIKVNGEQSGFDIPFKHDDLRAPEGQYAISKAKAEEGLLKISDETNMEVTIIRPPLVYGPSVQANFASLLNLAKLNVPLPLGSINNKRSLIALDNLVNLIITCIDHPNAGNQIFLASDDNDVSTPELFSIMVKAYGKQPRLININTHFLKFFAGLAGKKNMIERLCGDLSVDIWHTKRTLGWAPIVSVDQGIKKCIETSLAKKK